MKLGRRRRAHGRAVARDDVAVHLEVVGRRRPLERRGRAARRRGQARGRARRHGVARRRDLQRRAARVLPEVLDRDAAERVVEDLRRGSWPRRSRRPASRGACRRAACRGRSGRCRPAHSVCTSTPCSSGCLAVEEAERIAVLDVVAAAAGLRDAQHLGRAGERLHRRDVVRAGRADDLHGGGRQQAERELVLHAHLAHAPRRGPSRRTDRRTATTGEHESGRRRPRVQAPAGVLEAERVPELVREHAHAEVAVDPDVRRRRSRRRPRRRSVRSS